VRVEIDLERIGLLDGVLRRWLGEPGITITCGDWGGGSIMELVPQGKAQLSAAKYEGAFAGLRDLELEGVDHHAHLDLGRMSRVLYRIAPSVCFGFRSSFEVCLFGGGREVPALTVALSRPWRGADLAQDQVARWFARYLEDRRLGGAVVSLAIEKQEAPRWVQQWPAIVRAALLGAGQPCDAGALGEEGLLAFLDGLAGGSAP
jgi:hypothetical protein